MAFKSCKNCGIAVDNDTNPVECFKYGIKDTSENTDVTCTYYTEIQYEDGEAMTLLQHLLLKEQELMARKMKGVI